MRRLVVTLLVLAVLLVAADRVALVFAERAVAAQLQTAGSLSSRPRVSILGFPFLTQALAGRYDEVQIAASEITAGGGRISEFQASFFGVHVPLSAALQRSVTQVPVDRVTATITLSYADLQQQLRDRRLSLAPAGSELRVTGSVQVFGRTVQASALSTVALRGTEVVVTARQFQVGNAVADRVLTAALAGRFDFVARIGRLPYGLALTGIAVRPQGIVATAAGAGVVLAR